MKTIIGLLALCATSTAFADSAALRFGWVKDTRCVVNSEVSRDDGKSTKKVALKFNLNVSALTNRLHLAVSDLQFDNEKVAANVGDVPALAAAFLPDFDVGKTGGIFAIGDAKSLSDRLKTAMGDSAATAASTAGFASLADRSTFEQRIAQFWSPLVGFWHGLDLDLGDGYELTSTEFFPLDAAVDYGATNKVIVRAEKECTREGATPACVSANLTRKPSSGEVEKLIAKFNQRAGSANPKKPQLKSANFDSNAVLVTEAATLLPHSLVTDNNLIATYSDGRSEVSKVHAQYSFNCAVPP